MIFTSADSASVRYNANLAAQHTSFGSNFMQHHFTDFVELSLADTSESVFREGKSTELLALDWTIVSLLRDAILAVRSYEGAGEFAEDVDAARLREEVMSVLLSGIFHDELSPTATIDRYGDLSFLIDDGHVRLDIGVSGTGEISFFVEDPETGPDLLGDEPFEDQQVPEGLRNRMSAIQMRRRHNL